MPVLLGFSSIPSTMMVEVLISMVSFNHIFPHIAACTTHLQTLLPPYLIKDKLLGHMFFNMILQDVNHRIIE